METLRRTVAQLCPLVLQLRQKREMEPGPTLLAHVCFISRLTRILTKSLCLFPYCFVSDLSADSYPVFHICFLTVCVSNGRAVHYNGSSLLQWKSVRLDVALLPGETGAKWFLFCFFYFL